MCGANIKDLKFSYNVHDGRKHTTKNALHLFTLFRNAIEFATVVVCVHEL